ncbi:CorA metal ion transporter [Vanrija albida]|uniref:CorA metal ion transporter n=1 Tax=Vanrija albida TaxID=181172 RepID=A0ABR3PUP1_9TREE
MSPTQPTSPRQIQIDVGSPAHPRAMSSTSSRSPVNALGGPAHRGSSGTSYRDNVDVKRQMQQDIDSAMSMSRARSGSLVEGSPVLMRPSRGGYSASSPIEEAPFGMLSDAEEREMDRARHQDHDGSDDGHFNGGHYGREHGSAPLDSADSVSTYQSKRGRESDSDRERRYPEHPDHHFAASPGGIRSHFDFAPMEEFADTERAAIVAEEGGAAPEGLTRRRSTAAVRSGDHGDRHGSSGSASSTHREGLDSSTENVLVKPYSTELERTMTTSAFGDDTDPDAFSPKENESPAQTNFHRRRARKQSSQNQTGRRGGKLALFESFGGGNGEDDAVGGVLKAPRQGKQPPTEQPPPFVSYSDAPPGHDRPYRFSFYSNALPVTIHARTLAELPAEGQTFEDLFKGRNGAPGTAQPMQRSDTNQTTTKSAAGTPTNEPSLLSLNAPKNPPNIHNLALANANKGAVPPYPGAPGGPGGPAVTAEEDPEAFTWWLDVLSPTDDEMRMLSRVFGIHPLTTEDILLEETREKIELFRNYYLVCFRSFDQDPYSQTYLEPLNMYIIVFREGTLSFHFRATPHPQNVRRRIKHLKDYISVTSDWISYALIDDITDAFGPLIQSIEYEVDSIDELVLILKEAEQTDMLRRIGTCRKKVMGLLRLMGSKADVVKGLAKRCNENWLVAPKSDIGLYLSDIQDHLITMTSNLNHYEKILSRSHSNYLAQISIEMTDANNQINDVLSKLTALGTVLIPMNLVTGLWGMNVHVPGQDIEEGYVWFGSILGCLALFAILGAWGTYKCFVR